MDKDLARADFATKTKQRLVDSIKFMDTVKVVSNEQPPTAATHKTYAQAAQPLAAATVPKLVPVNVYNDKTETQGVIEKRLVGQLGDRFENAKLLELSRNNYLISNDIRLPVLGVPAPIAVRDKENVTTKAYIKMKDNEFYISRRLVDPYVSNLTNTNLQKYVLDPQYRQSSTPHTRQEEVIYANPNIADSHTGSQIDNNERASIQMKSAHGTLIVSEHSQQV